MAVQQGVGGRPDPDPTVLTTENLQREIVGVKDLIERAINSLAALTAEQFKGVHRELELVEARRVELKSDSGTTLAAALAAAKEAVGKTETNFAEQLKQLGVLAATEREAANKALVDLKERVQAIESTKLGNQEAVNTRQASNSAIYAGIGAVVTLILALIAVVAFVAANDSGGQSQPAVEYVGQPV